MYDPDPPFTGGSLKSASADTIDALRRQGAALHAQRGEVARRVGAKLGVEVGAAEED